MRDEAAHRHLAAVPTQGSPAGSPDRSSSASAASGADLDSRVCEISIPGIAQDATFAAARWELFRFPTVRHVFRIGTTSRALIIYAGHEPQLRDWMSAVIELNHEQLCNRSTHVAPHGVGETETPQARSQASSYPNVTTERPPDDE